MSAAFQTFENMTNGSFVYPLTPFYPPPSPPPSFEHHVYWETPLDCSSASSTSNHQIYPPFRMMPKTTFFHPQQNSPHPHHSSGHPILLDNPKQFLNLSPLTSLEQQLVEGGGGDHVCLPLPSEGSVIKGSIEKYELIRRLQENVYGAVYHAKGLSSHDDVAVKVLSRKAIKEFDRVLPETPLAEVFFTPYLRDHENVLSIREVFEYPACHFVVSDFAEGEDLMELLKHYPVGLPQVLVASFIRQAAQGLLWCHRQGLAFQDFSLENCLLFFEREDKEASPTVRVRVCDPGQAVRFRIDPRTGEEIPVPYKGCVGKRFRPPEIFLKGREYLASKVDSWCLGWSTFYLLLGVEIFGSVCPADLRWELFVNKEYDELFDYLGVLDDFSPIAQHFVLRLLDPIPHQRMSIAEALQHPFLADAEHVPVYVHDIPSLRQRFKNYQRNTNSSSNNDTCEDKKAKTNLGKTSSSRNRFIDAKFQESLITTTTSSSSSPSSSSSFPSSSSSFPSSSSASRSSSNSVSSSISNKNNGNSNSSNNSSNSCSGKSSNKSSSNRCSGKSSNNSSNSSSKSTNRSSKSNNKSNSSGSKSQKENTTNNKLKSRKKLLPPIIPDVYFSKYQGLYCTSDKPSGVNNNQNITTTTPSVIPLLPYTCTQLVSPCNDLYIPHQNISFPLLPPYCCHEIVVNAHHSIRKCKVWEN